MPAFTSQSSYVIVIDGNGNFTSENGVVSGNGSAENPYVIENWTFSFSDGPYGPYLEISNTDSYVVLRNLRFAGSTIYADDGIALNNVTNCQVLASRFENVYVGLEANHCSHLSIDGSFFDSSRIQIDDSDNISLTDNDLVDCGINLGKCEDLIVEDNSVSNFGIGVFGYPLYVDRCWNVTLKNNSLDQGGLVLFCLNLSQYESHTIGPDNTVDGGPLRVYKDTSGIDLTGVLTGQLVILNCSFVRMNELSVATSRTSMLIAYVDNVSLTNSTFDEKSGSTKYLQCSHVTISNNSFSNNSTTTLDGCSNVSFTDNYYDGRYGTGLAGYGTSINQCVDVLLKNNTFIEQDWEVFVFECVRLRMLDNAFPLRGLRFQDEDPERYATHVIDQTNTVGGRPVYYYAGVSNITIDASKAGQVILGDCQDVDVVDFEARDQAYCVQLMCVNRVNVTSCKFTDDLCAIMISNSTTVIITKCTIDCPYGTFDFTPSLDIRIYHNNFVSSGFGWSSSGGFGRTIEGNISWDNGYPSGGNYWKYDTHTDSHKGPYQSHRGSDGIVDNPHSLGDLGADRYPLAHPYGSSQLPVWLAAMALVITGVIAAIIVVNLRKRKPTPAEPSSDTEGIQLPQS